jgi:hypothetical protein
MRAEESATPTETVSCVSVHTLLFSVSALGLYISVSCVSTYALLC